MLWKTQQTWQLLKIFVPSGPETGLLPGQARAGYSWPRSCLSFYVYHYKSGILFLNVNPKFSNEITCVKNLPTRISSHRASGSPGQLKPPADTTTSSLRTERMSSAGANNRRQTRWGQVLCRSIEGLGLRIFVFKDIRWIEVEEYKEVVVVYRTGIYRDHENRSCVVFWRPFLDIGAFRYFSQ